MDRMFVCCSKIKSAGYEHSILELEFHNGDIFRYFSVPGDVYLGLYQLRQNRILSQIYKQSLLRNKNF